MEKKEFSKFFIASLKRTAQNVGPLTRRKEKVMAEIANLNTELQSLNAQIDAYQGPIKEATGGYTTEDLVERVVELTGKLDKDGKPIKMTKWVLKYPDSVVPPTEVPTTSEVAGSDFDIDSNASTSAVEEDDLPFSNDNDEELRNTSTIAENNISL